MQLDPDKSFYLRASPSSSRWTHELRNPTVLQGGGGAPGGGRAPLELAVVEATGRRPDLAGSYPSATDLRLGRRRPGQREPMRVEGGGGGDGIGVRHPAQEGEKGASARMRWGRENASFQIADSQSRFGQHLPVTPNRKRAFALAPSLRPI